MKSVSRENILVVKEILEFWRHEQQKFSLIQMFIRLASQNLAYVVYIIL